MSIPDNWEDTVETPVVKKYQDIKEVCPKLYKRLRKLSAYECRTLLTLYMEAVFYGKPKMSEVGHMRNWANKNKDKEDLKRINHQWLDMIADLGLKENSQVHEKTAVKELLHKYVPYPEPVAKFVLSTTNGFGSQMTFKKK